MSFEGYHKSIYQGNKIPLDWNKAYVKDVAKINRLTVKKSDNLGLIRYIDIASVTNRLIHSIQEIDFKDAPSRARRVVKDKDILISTVRPNLKHFTILNDPPNNTIASTGFVVITPEKIDPYFLYYFLTTDKYTEYLTGIAESQTSAYPAFNPDVIENSIVFFPSIDEQKRIASILWSLDKKIELNHQINKDLEEMAQALFKRWFIDFEFPIEKGEPYKSSGGEFVDSELGPIPKGWRVNKLGKICTISGGGTPKTKVKEYWENGDVLWATPSDLTTQNSLVIFDTSRKITKLGLEKSAAKLLPKGSILMTSRATIGFTAITMREMATNQGFINVICNKDVSNFFMLFCLRSIKEKIIGLANGSTFLEVSKSNFKDIDLVIPPNQLIEAFDKIVEPIINLIYKHQQQNQILSNLRDTLLPKLVSGEIRVPIHTEGSDSIE